MRTILDLETIFFRRQENIIEQLKEKKLVTKMNLLDWLTEVERSSHHIGLTDVSEQAAYLINELEHSEQTFWKEEDWSDFIQPFMLLFNRRQQPKSDSPKHHSERNLLLLFDNEVSSLDAKKQMLESRGYEVIFAANVERTIRLFYDYRPNVILLNVDGSEDTVFKLVQRLTNRALESFISIIVMGENIPESVQKDLFDFGVSNILDKSISGDLLGHLIANRIRLQSFMKSSVLVDELTKAYNRSFLQQSWVELFDDHKKHGHPFSLAILDLDYFKQVNDRYGHAVGDDVLINFSKCVSINKNDHDRFIRYGGEEFILLMPGLTQEQAVKHIKYILSEFVQTTHQSNTEPFKVSFTAGVCEIKPEILDVRTHIEKADQALYYGKESGRNRVEGYRKLVEQLQLAANDDLVLKIALIDDDRFIRHFLEDRLTTMDIESYKIEVSTFADGESFLNSNWYLRSGPKIILLDIILPNMDGLEVLEQVYTVEDKELAIMMLTGIQKNRDMIRALELGADDYITKPFSFDQLESRIQRLIDRLISRD